MTTTVLTTLPLIPERLPMPILSPRLIIRPLRLADLDAFRRLRSQPEAMAHSRRGRPDADLGETLAKLERLQAPCRDSHLYFGIFLRRGPTTTTATASARTWVEVDGDDSISSSSDGTGSEGGDGGDGSSSSSIGSTAGSEAGVDVVAVDEEGDLIGDGGVHRFASEATGWPEFGYKIRKEYWGRGYATEFACAFMRVWWALPRTYRTITVARSSLYDDDDNDDQHDPVGYYDWDATTTPDANTSLEIDMITAAERMCAWTTTDNVASQRVLRKVGFELFEGLENGLVNWRYVC
jgi:RimJ/RimL family protein N-acetyltransferase